MSNNCECEDLLETVKRQLPSTDSFSSLTASCDGAFPARIADALRNLSPKFAGASERLAEADRPHAFRPFSDCRLPLPHPIDFEWRFSNATIDELLRRLNAIAGPRGKLLFVCTPAVALRAFDAKNPRQLIYASRMDDAVTVRLKQICGEKIKFVEVRDDLSQIGAAAALVDPPWYDDIALPLVTQALRGLQEGGGLLVGIPDRLSGCSSAPILSSIATDARPFGMDRAQPLPGKLRYETPYFELNTLRHLGLRGIHPRWRTGRAVFGRRMAKCIPEHRFPVDDTWREVGLVGWRMRLRRVRNDYFARPHPIRLNIRASVSRFASLDGLEECWTVGNRVAYGMIGEPEGSGLRELAQTELEEVRRFVTDREEPKNVIGKRQIMISAREAPIYSMTPLN